MKLTTKDLLTGALALAVTLALPVTAHPQSGPDQTPPAIENRPADTDEPSLEDLLGLSDDADAPDADEKPADDGPDADGDAAEPEAVAPELTRDLDKALTGQQAADQFSQAIQEMEEVAIRLSDEADPGVDTQRMQDEIILKLEQIIASAEKTESKQQSLPGQGKPQQGQPRGADKQQGQQPGQQQGDQPGEQPGQQPGDEQGQQPGDQPGQAQGEGQGQQQQAGEQPGGQDSGQSGSRGSVRNEELSMKDLREGEWGNLPPRLRDELAESLSETFNPVYRSATEAFFRRIAEMSQQQAEESGE